MSTKSMLEMIPYFYEDVYTFNEIAGVFESKDTPQKQIERAVKIFKEECNETIDAAKDLDSVELLDGVCDVFVTLSGLMQVMDNLGFNVQEALQRVCQNNLEKYPDGDKEVLAYQPLNTECTYNEWYDVHVFKDKNGKVKKPVGFQPVELQDLCPSGIWES